MNRKLAREMAVCFLFQIEFQKENIKEQVEDFLDSYGDVKYDKDYFLEVINGVMNSLNEIDEIIETKAKDWTIDRIGAIERCILRLGISELFEGDAPYYAVIDDYVTLAKNYGDEKSASFVNGILENVKNKFSIELYNDKK